MGIYTCCWPCTLTLTMCMVVLWSRDGVVFLASKHLVTSSHLPCPDSTDAHWPPLGARVPHPYNGIPSYRIRAHSPFRVQNSYDISAETPTVLKGLLRHIKYFVKVFQFHVHIRVRVRFRVHVHFCVLSVSVSMSVSLCISVSISMSVSASMSI
jgi:hypothetical protein